MSLSFHNGFRIPARNIYEMIKSGNYDSFFQIGISYNDVGTFVYTHIRLFVYDKIEGSALYPREDISTFYHYHCSNCSPLFETDIAKLFREQYGLPHLDLNG